MRVMFVGDVIGRPGRRVVRERLADTVRELAVDFVIANGENVSGGFGITQKNAEELFDMGVHAITTGNHVWDKQEAWQYLAVESRIIRPANFPPGTPGSGLGIYADASGRKIAVINLIGRVFMHAFDDPFRKADELVAEARKQTPMIVVDMHAEASSEKQALGHYLDGRVSAVVGTHTHVPTADTRILKGGTGFQTDLGLSGSYDSVIGMQKEAAIERFLAAKAPPFEPAKGDLQMHGALFDIDDKTGRCREAMRVERRID